MKIAALIFLFLFFACKKADNEIINLHNGRIFVIGHGGAGFENAFNYLPENSMGSIHRAIEIYNSDGVEVDVQLSADNEIILFHDYRLETQTNCFGCVSSKTLTELRDCMYATNFAIINLTSEPVIALRDILDRFSGRKIPPMIFLDVKLFNECYDLANPAALYENYANAIIELINEFNYREHIFIESASEDFLKLLQLKDPSLKLIIDSHGFEAALDIVLENNFYGIVLANNSITKEQVQIAHNHNINIAIFSVRSRKSNLDAVNKHPDYIQTDEILVLQQILMNK